MDEIKKSYTSDELRLEIANLTSKLDGLKAVLDKQHKFQKFESAKLMIEFLQNKFDISLNDLVYEFECASDYYMEYIGKCIKVENEAHVVADDEIYTVFHFIDQGFYVEFTGWKDSYSDSEYTDYKQVTPTTKTVTVYE